MPTPEAKERTWAAVTSRRVAVEPRVGRLRTGFWQPGQDALLQPYVDRYVAELPGLWAARTPQVAGTLAQRLFPSTLVETDVLARTAVLEADGHPAGLRRYVAEARSDLARALRCRSLG